MNIQKQKRVIENIYISVDIVNEILSKLPVKDVIRCSVVCKSWNSLIKNPTFIQTHLNNQTSELFLLSSRQSHDLHWGAASFGHYLKLLHPIYNDKNNSAWTKDLYSKVVGTCNGLVCLAAVSAFQIDPSPPVILWNPSIRKFGFLPSPSLAVKWSGHLDETYNFCYDSRIGDYKVVRSVKEPKCKVEVEVWSLAKGTWKSLNNVPADFCPYPLRNNGFVTFVNGAFHWIQRHETSNLLLPCDETSNLQYLHQDFTVSVIALDMVDETFRNVEIRQGFWRECLPKISRYHGDGDQLWLALFEYPDGNSCFDLWVMKEYGVAESWTKLFNVCLLGSPDEEFGEPWIEPFGLTKNGQVVVERMGRYGELGSFMSYDPEDKEFRDFGNQGYRYYFMDSYVESLVFLGLTNVFSY